MIYLIRHTISFCMQQYTDRNFSYKFIKHGLSFTLRDTEKDEINFQNYISPRQKKEISSISEIVNRHSLLTFGATKTFEFYHAFTTVQKNVAAERNDVSL